MADINYIISLGIGSPAAIPEFLTLGLQVGAAAALPSPTVIFDMPKRVTAFGVARPTCFDMPERNTTFGKARP